MSRKHYDIIIKGNVQNIGLTFQAMKTADELQIFGYAKYLNKNEVKIEAEGEEKNLEKYLLWCKTVLPETRISNIVVKTNIYKEFKEFVIVDKVQFQ